MTLPPWLVQLGKIIMEVFLGEIIKIFTGPDTVAKEVVPVLKTVDPTVTVSEHNTQLINRFSGL